LPSRYHFQALAIGAGGRLVKPHCENIEIQASSALPEIGGYGTARSTAFRHRDILHFDIANSEVTGTRTAEEGEKQIYCTTARSIVQHLNILNVVTARRVVANLVSTHEGDVEGAPSIKLEGTHFEDLRIDGVPVEVDLAVDLLDQHHTHELAQNAYKKDKKFRAFFDGATLKGKLQQAPERVRQWFPEPAANAAEMPHTNGVTTLSLVRAVKTKSRKLKCWGNVIYIEGFGTIHLAELHISKSNRRLTMIRVDLGSPVVGAMAVCTVVDGGSTY
jgi:hypothetical protein